MSTKYHTLSIHLEVTDVNSLYQAAFKHAIEVDLLDEELAIEMLKPNGEVSVGDCLQMLHDPGVSPSGCQILYRTHEETVYTTIPRENVPRA